METNAELFATIRCANFDVAHDPDWPAATRGAPDVAQRIYADAVKGLARLMIRRWNLNDEVATFIGTAIVVALVILVFFGIGYAFGRAYL